MGAHLELLAGIFVDVGRAKNGHGVLLSRQRDRAGDRGTRTGGGVDDLLGGLVNYFGIVGLEADTNTLLFRGFDFWGCHGVGTIFRSY